MFRTGEGPGIAGAYLQLRDPATGQKFRLLRSRRRARASQRHPRAPVPARPRVGQRRAAAHGQAARPAGARRVLGLLPRQLAAHAAVPEGVARALRRRRAARDRRSTPAASSPRATPTRSARRSRGSGSSTRCVIDERLELWDFYGNEGWPARYLWDARGQALLDCTTARAPTPRPSARSRRCSASSASLVAAAAPEDEPRACCSRPRPPTSRAVLRPVRGRPACGRCSRARDQCAPTAASSRSTGRRPTC